MKTEPAFRYIVIRAHPDLPPGFLPPDMEGKWFDLNWLPNTNQLGTAVAVVTDRFERRDDGATARVYEVRP